MKVEKGFKQTNVGVIPEDWEVKQLSEISNIVRGGSPRPAGDKRYFNGNYIPWLTVASITNISDSQIFVEETPTSLTKAGAKQSRIIDENTIVIANSGFSLGVAKLLSMRSCANDGIAALTNFSKLENQTYVVYYLNSITKQLRKIIAIGNDQPNLNIERIGKIKVPLPPTKKEQTNIAEALSEIDELILCLDKLVAKKRNIKQATMQLLLTGKKRLKGFTGELNKKPLSELIVKLNKTSHPSSLGKSEGVYPFFTNSSNEVNKFVDNFDFDTEAIIANTGGVAFFDYYKGRFSAMADCYVFKTKCDTRFLYYVLKQKEKYINEVGFTGSGIKHLDKKLFLQVEVLLPDSINEQNAISNLLMDIDNEIKTLQIQSAKYKLTKQGMIQNLLTGKVRLV